MRREFSYGTIEAYMPELFEEFHQNSGRIGEMFDWLDKIAGVPMASNESRKVSLGDVRVFEILPLNIGQGKNWYVQGETFSRIQVETPEKRGLGVRAFGIDCAPLSCGGALNSSIWIGHRGLYDPGQGDLDDFVCFNLLNMESVRPYAIYSVIHDRAMRLINQLWHEAKTVIDLLQRYDIRLACHPNKALTFPSIIYEKGRD